MLIEEMKMGNVGDHDFLQLIIIKSLYIAINWTS